MRLRRSRVTASDVIASKLTPTGECIPTVGVSLLAIAVSKPDSIPKWIVPNSPYQPRPQRVCDDIASSLQQILVITQCSVVKPSLPKLFATSPRTIHRNRTPGLCTLHQPLQCSRMKLDQPMKMVGHDDPSQGSDMALLLRPSEFLYYQSAQPPVRENRLAVLSYRGK